VGRRYSAEKSNSSRLPFHLTVRNPKGADSWRPAPVFTLQLAPVPNADPPRPSLTSQICLPCGNEGSFRLLYLLSPHNTDPAITASLEWFFEGSHIEFGEQSGEQ
jgi:hypothetical protein